LEGGVPPDCVEVIAAEEAMTIKKVEAIAENPHPSSWRWPQIPSHHSRL
jgi:hypothetical protein